MNAIIPDGPIEKTMSINALKSHMLISPKSSSTAIHKSPTLRLKTMYRFGTVVSLKKYFMRQHNLSKDDIFIMHNGSAGTVIVLPTPRGTLLTIKGIIKSPLNIQYNDEGIDGAGLLEKVNEIIEENLRNWGL